MVDVLLYSIGDRDHGMGHISRSIVLADELARRGHLCRFATAHETPGLSRLRRSPHVTTDYHPDDLSWTKRGGDVLVVDMEGGPDRALLDAARPRFRKIVVVAGSGWALRDEQAVREGADLVVCQTIAVPDEDDGYLYGAEWIMIDPRFAACAPNPGGPIVISFGGGDPHDLTWLAAGALLDADVRAGREIIQVVGPAAYGTSLSETDAHVVLSPDSLADILGGASLLVGQFGMTAYEAAAAGVPSVLYGLSENHISTALRMQQENAAVVAGQWDEFNKDDLISLVASILGRDETWRAMSAAGKRLIDGQGVVRVADAIEKLSDGGAA